MSKKKNSEEELSYLQMPLPEGSKRSKLTKISFHGLNMAQTLDTGVLCDEKNISTTYAPYLTPSEQRGLALSDDKYKNAVSIHGFEDCLIVIYTDTTQTALMLDYIKFSGGIISFIKTGTLVEAESDSDLSAEEQAEYLNKPRSVVRFNLYDSEDVINGKYSKKLLIFPDKKSMDFEQSAPLSESPDSEKIELSDLSIKIKTYTRKGAAEPYGYSDKSYYQKNVTEGSPYYGRIYVWGKNDYGNERWIRCTEYENGGYPACPDIDYATVHVSRVFGVGNGRVFASGFNDYSNWNLDTSDDYNESNAWVSATQSSSEADSPIVGITTFQSHVVVFKKNFMHEIYNTKNPFRIQDIFNEGCIDGRTIQEVDGRLIFLSQDNVKIYNGGNPESIGYPLGIERFNGTKAVAGTDGRKYYLYCDDYYPGRGKKKIYVYDTYCEQWAVEETDYPVIGFANNQNNLYMLCEDGGIYAIGTRVYNGQQWSFETDLYTGNSIDIKHLSKIQVLCDMNKGSELEIYMLLDGEVFDKSTMEPLYSTIEQRDGTHKRSIRFVPRKTANYGFKLHFEGKEYVKIYSLEMLLTAGGEKYIE